MSFDPSNVPNIPQLMRDAPNWLGWRSEVVNGKPTKVPYRALCGGKRAKAATDNPNTWAPFDKALSAFKDPASGLDGIGFVFSENVPLFGVDIDKCLNPETGELAPWAAEIVDALPIYWEISPSGTGLHGIGEGTRAPFDGMKTSKRIGEGKLELFAHGVYFTVTGEVYGGHAAVSFAQWELDALYKHLWQDKPDPAAERPDFSKQRPADSDDNALLERMFKSKNGSDIKALWEGDTSAYPKGDGEYDHSAADQALCNHLAWWCNYDAAHVDALFRQSGLMRSKWDKKHYSDGTTYGQGTILTALAGKQPGEGYQPKGKGPRVTYTQNDEDADTADTAPWPDPLSPEAFHGIAGQGARLIAPHTEADEAALLFQFLAAAGNAIGRTGYFRIESDRHYANLNVAIVGNSAKGRKGTSQGRVMGVMAAADPNWIECKASGLSSGEGLIWNVRDPIMKKEAVKEKGKVTGYQEVMADEGVSDKRLLVLESELASALKVMRREGNTLSAVVRNAWDTGALRILTKNSPARSTGAHISIIGHITKTELLRHLDATEMANGFANRFLWVCVQRSKELPHGGDLSENDIANMGVVLGDTLRRARNIERLTMDEEARESWAAIYSELSEAKPGLFGAIIARSEAQVLRLAVTYALLDVSKVIRQVHLEAALACWIYAEASARYLFGETLGDPIADTILQALRTEGKKGITRTGIRDLFDRNAKASEIDRALKALLEANLVRWEKQPRQGQPGRPTEVWYVR